MRSRPVLEVWCDGYRCRTVESLGLVNAPGVDVYLASGIGSRLESLGWRVEDGRDICPDCVEKESKS